MVVLPARCLFSGSADLCYCTVVRLDVIRGSVWQLAQASFRMNDVFLSPDPGTRWRRVSWCPSRDRGIGVACSSISHMVSLQLVLCGFCCFAGLRLSRYRERRLRAFHVSALAYACMSSDYLGMLPAGGWTGAHVRRAKLRQWSCGRDHSRSCLKLEMSPGEPSSDE